MCYPAGFFTHPATGYCWPAAPCVYFYVYKYVLMHCVVVCCCSMLLQCVVAVCNRTVAPCSVLVPANKYVYTHIRMYTWLCHAPSYWTMMSRSSVLVPVYIYVCIDAVCRSIFQCVAVCCSMMLQCVAVCCCSVLQCVLDTAAPRLRAGACKYIRTYIYEYTCVWGSGGGVGGWVSRWVGLCVCVCV